jgi:hypothetical protein
MEVCRGSPLRAFWLQAMARHSRLGGGVVVPVDVLELVILALCHDRVMAQVYLLCIFGNLKWLRFHLTRATHGGWWLFI